MLFIIHKNLLQVYKDGNVKSQPSKAAEQDVGKNFHYSEVA